MHTEQIASAFYTFPHISFLNLYSVMKRLESAQVFSAKVQRELTKLLSSHSIFCFILPSNVFAICVCKGTHLERSSWKRSYQQPIICWPGGKPRRCPSRESKRRLTRTRRWPSSNLASLQNVKHKRRTSSLAWTLANYLMYAFFPSHY